MRTRFALGIPLLLLPLAAAQEPALGAWQAWLDSPGGRLEFGLDLAKSEAGVRAVLVNGQERIAPVAVRVTDAAIVIDLGHYDATLEAELSADGRSLDGRWRKRRGVDTFAEMPFHARHGAGPTLRDAPEAADAWVGRFAVQFAQDQHPAVAILHAAGAGAIDGTFLTALGDYRFLRGQATPAGLELSCFDGAHAFLFRARRGDDGAIEGDFWSADRWHETWTATPDDAAALPDPLGIARVRPDAKVTGVLPSVQGKPLDLAEFAGRPTVLLLFGSWCPNCHDATDTLVTLHREFAGRGLQVVGLAFEVTADAERNRRVLRLYAERHRVPWPIALAGPADKAKATAAFPYLERIVAYPTIVFVDRDGAARAVFSGFTGPAAPADHARVVAQWRGILEALVR